jgi:hypothetical protein
MNSNNAIMPAKMFSMISSSLHLVAKPYVQAAQDKEGHHHQNKDNVIHGEPF